MPQSTPANLRQLTPRGIPDGKQLGFDTQERRDELVSALYELTKRCVSVFGGADALRATLDEKQSYITTISKSLNRVDDNGQRRVPLEWIAALMTDEKTAHELIVGLCEMVGLDPPALDREVEDEDMAEATRRVMADLDPEMRELFKKRYARVLGVRPERVRF